MEKNKNTSIKKNQISRHSNDNPFLDVLRGRVPLMENKVLEFIYFIVTVAFWAFVVWKIGSWTLSIPGVSVLLDLYKKARSP